MTRDTSIRAKDRTETRAPRWASVLLALALAIFLAYDVWEAVGNLVGVTTLASQLDVSVNPLGWTVLILAIVLPVVILMIALRVAFRRGVISKVLVYLTAVGVSAALYLSILALYAPGSFLS